MRTWDALEPSYRLSTCFVVRAVLLDQDLQEAPPVVATGIGLGAGLVSP